MLRNVLRQVLLALPSWKVSTQTLQNLLYGAVIAPLSLFAVQANAALETGFGMSATHVPHYIGSDQSRNYYLPFPYIHYRSEKLNIDRNLIQSKLWGRGNLSLEVSLGGSIPVDSEDNRAREGMDDLDFIIEAGPALHYYFLGDRTKDNALFVSLPLRGAIVTNFTYFHGQGLTSNPSIVWRRGYQLGQYQIKPQIILTARHANSGYHDYIYGVDSEFATENRSAYQGKDGYGGWSFSYSTIVRWQDKLLGVFVNYVNTDRAVFDDSPLYKQRSNLFAGVALAHIF